MGQIEDVISLTREIESLLEQLGASGKGLHQKISSIENRFDRDTIKQLRWVATLRNKIVHEHGFKIDNMSDYKSTAKSLIKKLKQMKKSKKKEGCFIATAVYGSYDCEEVLVLRRYRDQKLLTNPFGRVFVCFYYAVSPSLARRINAGGFLARNIRHILDKIVYRIVQHRIPLK